MRTNLEIKNQSKGAFILHGNCQKNKWKNAKK